MKEHHISIWFLIGLQLAIFGVLIAGVGIFDLIFPPPPGQQTVLADLHASIWWGGIMLALGIFYTARFWPGKMASGE
jgi:hypothetical protein